VSASRNPDLPAARAPLRIAVLISGSGRSLANLLDATSRGELGAEVVAVVSSVARVRGLEIAADDGVPATTITRKGYASDDAYAGAVYDWLAPYAPDLIVLAGFLRKLTVPPEWEGRILNIHPALATAFPYASGRGFYGDRVHAAVLANGDTRSGATIHVVDNGYDTGPVVAEIEVPVMPDDTPQTLAARVFAAECALYPATIREYVAAHPELFGHRNQDDDPWTRTGG
jgi:formyltetrahydrofolate-dependent phosphoribosylglycinamide formyltransferase